MNGAAKSPATRRPLTKLWRRWHDLTVADRRDTVRAALLLPSVKARLNRHPVKDVIAWATASPRLQEPADLEYTMWTAVHATGRAAAYGLVRGNCLSRSLTLIKLLSERGIAAELCLGTRLSGGALVAHAWVERGGVALNDPRGFAVRFARLLVSPAAGAALDGLTRDAFR